MLLTLIGHYDMTQVCSSENGWSTHCDQEASVFLPVLSPELYGNLHMKKLLEIAHNLRMRILPIRHRLPLLEVQQSDAFLARWLVTADSTLNDCLQLLWQSNPVECRLGRHGK